MEDVGVQHVGERFGCNSSGQEWVRFEFYDHRHDESSLRLQVKISCIRIVKTKLSDVKESGMNVFFCMCSLNQNATNVKYFGIVIT